MIKRVVAPRAFLGIALLGICVGVRAQAVVTQHNDNQRTGAYTTETRLTPANVRPDSFDRLYSLTFEGQIAAQPLFVPALVSPRWRGTRDVLFVATRTNKVYAFNVGAAVATRRLLWTKDLRDSRGLQAEELPGMDRRFPDDPRDLCLQTHGPVGITGTPVIEPATHTMWVVYRTSSPFDAHKYDARFTIEKLDIRTGTKIAMREVAPADPQFDANRVLPRPALLLDHGVIYLGFGASVCDDGGGRYFKEDPGQATDPTKHPHGWVVALDANSLVELAHFNTTPQSMLGGIWQSSYGLAADANGDVYAFTGNNQGLAPEDPAVQKRQLSEAALKLHLNRRTRSFDVTSYQPSQAARDALDAGDTDLASGGPVVLPNGHVTGGGKQGVLYVFDPHRMQAPLQAFQAFYNSWHAGIAPCDYDLDQDAGPNIHGTPVVWTSSKPAVTLLYGMPEKEYLKSFRMTKHGIFFDRPFASTLESGFRSPRGMPGGFLSLSANGGKNGIVWVSSVTQESTNAVNTSGQFLGRLSAFDAADLRKLWEASDTVSFAKFIPPTIAAGKVFRAAYENEIVVYGLTGRAPRTHITKVNPVRPVTAVWRDRDHLDLYMTSRDRSNGNVLTASWEGANCSRTQVARGWRGWFPIHSGMDIIQDSQPLPDGYLFSAAASAEVTPVWRNPKHLDLFVASAGGFVESIVWEDPENPATAKQENVNRFKTGWQSWFPIGAVSGHVLRNQPITAVWRDAANPSHLDLFIVDREGRIMSTFFDNDTWQAAWFPVAGSLPGQSTPGQKVTAVWRNNHHLDLFATNRAGQVISAFFDDDHWQSGWFPVAAQSGVVQPGATITALWRNPDHLDLFATDRNGTILSTYFEGNRWAEGWFPVASGVALADPVQPVTALWRNSNHLDLFITSKAGRVMSTFFEGNAWQSNWFPIAPASGSAAPGQPVTAVWSNSEHLDLFISAPDGTILSIFFQGNRWADGWFRI